MTDTPSPIIVGTASWTDKTLIASGKFYPPEVKSPEERLRFYASQFRLLEVDSSYYALPSAANSARWAERTPPGFTFNVKAFRLFTGHQTEVKAFPKDLQAAIAELGKTRVYYKDVPEEVNVELWARFREALRPLYTAGKLGAIHFQFSPWTAFHPEAFAHIEQCLAALPGATLAIEFRNTSWFEGEHRASTLAFLRERDLVNVVVDEPQGASNSIPPVWAVTHPTLAIVRLHGRNTATWNAQALPSSAERFDYEYRTAELEELAEPILGLSREARKTQVLFNNCQGDSAQRNAMELRQILRRLQAAAE